MIGWLGLLVLAAESIVLPAATINGVVRDPTGYPMDQTVVWAATEDCLQSRRAVTNKQGQYSFEEVPAGTYKLYATHVGLWQIGERTVRVDSDTANDMDLELVVSDADTGGAPPSMPLHGTITDPNNHPVSGARITHSSGEPGFTIAARQNWVLSSSEGRFGFCRVTAERFAIRIERVEYRPRTIKVALGSGQNIVRELKIVLRKR